MMKLTVPRNRLKKLAGLVLAAAACSAPLLAEQEKELKDQAGKTIIRYVAEVPEGIAPAGTTDPSKQVGLFLCFPEHDRPTGDEILPVREALRRQGLSDNFIVIGGHPQGRKFGPEDHEPIEKLIAWAKKTYPINPRRIYMYGKGEGGKISGEFAATHTDLVTASISYSWGWWTLPAELKEAIDAEKSAPEMYLVLGLRDLSHHLTNVRDTYSRMQAKGYHIIYREVEDLGARTYHPPTNDDAIAWAARLRNKNIAPSAAEQALLKRAGNAGTDGYFKNLALVGGAPAGAVLEKLLASKDSATRAAAAETFRHGIFSEDAIAALGKSIVDPAANVRRAAIRALGINAQWRSANAQKLLIALATKPDMAVNPADRISATDGLVQAVRLQVKGVRQDPAVFAALVALLNDKDEELRTMASNVLAPIRDGDFRGDLGRPERKTPEGGWQQWLNEIAAKDASYLKDYDVCGRGGNQTGESLPGNRGKQEPVDLYCTGGSYLLGYNLATGKKMEKQPALAFQNTLKAAEQGYVPAQAQVGMMYAIGKGVNQNYPEAHNWWSKAAAAGHALAAVNDKMVPKGRARSAEEKKVSSR